MHHLAMLALMALSVTTAQAQWADEFVQITEPEAKDVYVAGRDVTVMAEVEQDIAAAGQRISIDARVGGDLIAAGESILIRREVGDDVRAAGRSIILLGTVGDHFLAAGEKVSIEREARVADRAWLAGQTIQVGGQVGGELRAAGRLVTLSGEVGGDAHILAEQIRIEPGAVIQGDLLWRSPNPPDISTQAQITGQLIQLPMPEPMAESSEFPGALLMVVGYLVAGIALYLLFPRASLSTALVARASPWKSLGLGLAGLVITPLAIILLFVTVVGYLLALMGLALYLVLLALGALVGLFVLGDLGLRLMGKPNATGKGFRVLSLVAAIAVVALVLIIPILGGLACLLVLIFGLGAIQLSLYRSNRLRGTAG